MIAVDRPGYGLSDFQPGRRILDWPIDVLRLADSLGLERFAVLGVSGGGPYAAVCAAKLPARVMKASLVCSVGPVDRPGAMREMDAYNRRLLFLARTVPGLVRLLAGPVIRVFWRYEKDVLPPSLLARLPERDQRTIERTELRQTLMASWQEAFRAGTRGMVYDGCLYAQPWGFELEEIVSPVQLWHGELDVNVPSSMGRAIASRLRNCCASFLPDEGHFSLPFGRFGEILKAAMSDK
jgi:pimeloyl-ACP methyl ester carboxylesterase